MRTLRLTSPELRIRLASPLGILVRGSPIETMKAFRDYLESEIPKKVIVVGDVVTHNSLKSGILSDVMIFDRKTLRDDLVYFATSYNHDVMVRNPKGTITSEAWAAIAKAVLEKERVRILVEGEEDLLALPAVLEAQVGSLVVYGQPREGIVLVDVTRRKKREAKDIVCSMEV